MEDDDIDLLLALQPDDAEPGNARTSAFHEEAAGSPPRRAGGTSARAYNSPEADKTSGPRSKVSLSAAFGTASAGTEEKAKVKVQKTAAPAREAAKGKPRQVPGKGDNVEAHSGLKIKNPLLPSIVVKERFAGARFLRLSKISSAFQGATPAGPWATAAVLSEKMTPRESASGRKYGLWKVTDLAGFTCSLFLFGDAFEAHWKESEGSVVGLLNAKYKEEKGGARSSAPFCLSAENGQQVFKLGTSADLGLCRGTRKDGMPCTMPINKSEGEYCQYHAAGAYQKLQKLQKAQEKGHRMDLGKGKLSREPHGRVMNNVFVSAPPAPLPRVGKSGAVNVVKPGQLQEQAEQEQRKRSNSQGSRQALAVAASIQQQQEKKAEKERNKAPGKHMTNGPGAIKPGPAKAPLAARAGPGPNTDVTRKANVTSLPKPASAFDRQAMAGKENLKRVAGATLGLDERERKRQQLERNRLRAEGSGARTEAKDVRTGADGIRTGMPLGADGSRTERNGMRVGPEGTGTVAGESRTERNGMRTELNGNRTERRDVRTKADGHRTDLNALRTDKNGVPEMAKGEDTTRNEERTERDGDDGNAGSPPAPAEGSQQTKDGSQSLEKGASTVKMEKGEAVRGKLTEEALRAALKGEAVRGKMTDEALRAALKGEAEEVPRLRIEKNAGSKGAGVVEPRAGRKDAGKREEELERQKDARTERRKGTEREGGQNGLNGRGTGATREGGSKMDTGDGEKTGGGTDERPKPDALDGLGRGDSGRAHAQQTERPERETLTERKHRIAARVAKMDDRGVKAVGNLGGDVRRANDPRSTDRLASNGLNQKGEASEKRPTPGDVDKSGQRPKAEASSERDGLKPSHGTVPNAEAGGLSNQHAAAREKREPISEQTHAEKTGSGRNNGATERRPESGTGVPSVRGPSDDVSKAAKAGASSAKGPSDDVSKAAEAEASLKRATGGGEIGGEQEKERPYQCAYCPDRFKTGAARRSHEQTSGFCIREQVMKELFAKKNNEGHRDAKQQKPVVVEPATKSRPKVEDRVPTECSEMRPRVQKRTLEGPPREDAARLKRRIVEESAKLSAQEREELVDLLRSSNKEGRSIIAGQRIKKVSASSGEVREGDTQKSGQGPRVRPAEGHVASNKGFAAAFRDVSGVEEGPRESVFRDMGDAEEIERALGSFDILEKKEELAAKMDKIQSVTVKGWRCDQCRRSTEKKPDLCVSENHSVRFCPKLVKRFWACAVCKERTDTVGKEYPDAHCRKCDGMHFKPTGMRYAVPTKETPYAARENFMARGKEHAFSLCDE